MSATTRRHVDDDHAARAKQWRPQRPPGDVNAVAVRVGQEDGERHLPQVVAAVGDEADTREPLAATSVSGSSRAEVRQAAARASIVHARSANDIARPIWSEVQ